MVELSFTLELTAVDKGELKIRQTNTKTKTKMKTKTKTKKNSKRNTEIKYFTWLTLQSTHL